MLSSFIRTQKTDTYRFMADDETNFANGLRISTLTYVLFMLNRALEKESWKDITFDDVYDHLDSGDLVAFLEDRLDIDLPIVTPELRQGRLLLPALRHAAEFLRGSERRKMGINQNGVCLIIGFIAELIQSGQWDLDSLGLSDPRG